MSGDSEGRDCANESGSIRKASFDPGNRRHACSKVQSGRARRHFRLTQSVKIERTKRGALNSRTVEFKSGTVTCALELLVPLRPIRRTPEVSAAPRHGEQTVTIALQEELAIRRSKWCTTDDRDMPARHGHDPWIEWKPRESASSQREFNRGEYHTNRGRFINRRRSNGDAVSRQR